MNQLIMILLISILVLVHEAGHFVAARIFNVRVTRFGIGMPIGPSWRLFKWKNTVFYIHAFLFGGYVSFAEPKPEINEKDDKKQELDDEEYLDKDSPELYENKTIGQKLIIVTAGVIMNVVFAIFLVMMCALIFHKLPSNSQNIYVASFSDKVTSNAQARGILPKDKILSVNNQKINTLYQLSFFAQNSKLFDNYAQESLYSENLKELKKLNSKIKNENEIIPQNIKINLPKTKTENPLNVNENVLKGLEKYKKDGIELNKTQIELRNEIYKQKDYVSKGNVTLKDIALSLSDTYKPVSIKVLRNNKEIEIKNIFVDKSGLFGMLLNVEEVYTQTKTPKQIVLKSLDYTYSTTAMMLFGLWQLLSGKVSAADMHGVIAVVKVGGDIIASKGFLNGILLTAMISMNLAIMNILPIPALDGGHVMFLIIEKVTGKKPDRELSEKITNFFFFLLIILMVSICYNDIFALVTRKF
mgnify:CR=1 FL=1